MDRYIELYLLLIIILSLMTGLIDAISLSYFVDIFSIETTEGEHSTLVGSILFFAGFTSVGYIFKIVLLWLNIWLSFKISNNLNKQLMNSALNVVNEKSTVSQTLNDISRVTEFVATNYILGTLKLISGCIVCIMIFLSLWINSDGKALSMILVLTLFYLLISRILKNTFGYQSSVIKNLTTKTVSLGKAILESRETITAFDITKRSVDEWSNYDMELKMVQSRGQFFANSPRLFIELAGVLMLAAFISIQNDNLWVLVSEIALMVVAAQRLLPIIQQSYAALTARRISAAQYWGIVERLMADVKNKDQHINLDKDFKTLDIAIKGNDGINKVELLRGDKLKILGPSGSGKTTLLRNIIGIIESDRVRIRLDGEEIKSLIGNVGYISQSAQLFMGTLKDNVTVFSDVSDALYRKIINTCGLEEVEKRLRDGVIDPNGTQLSGGESQRLLIARVLAMDTPIIAFDEAFTGLDKNAASDILSKIQINYSEKIKIFIEHSNILDSCDCKILNVQDIRNIL